MRNQITNNQLKKKKPNQNEMPKIGEIFGLLVLIQKLYDYFKRVFK